MSEKANLSNAIESYFLVDVTGQVNGLKFHVDELTGPDIASLALLLDDFPEIQKLLIKRSGTGLTVIFTL